MDINTRPKPFPRFKLDPTEMKFKTQPKLRCVVLEGPHQPIRIQPSSVFTPGISPHAVACIPAIARLKLTKIGQIAQKTFSPSQDLGSPLSNSISSSSENQRVIPYPRVSPHKDKLLSSIQRKDDIPDLTPGVLYIRRSPKEVVPEYWEHLDGEPMARARISERCFVFQDWNDRCKSLVVLSNGVFFSDAQYWKYNHVFRITNSKGETRSYCNCVNGKRQTLLCVRRELVEAHADGFGCVWYDSEPKCALVGLGFRGTMSFSVASDLTSPCSDGRHIRAIVMKDGGWTCKARKARVKDGYISLRSLSRSF